MIEIMFFVPGIPRPGGSKRVFPIRKAGILTGKFIVTDAAGQANKDWRASVAHEAKIAMEARSLGPLTTPVMLTLNFRLPRPKGHFNSKGVLKPSAPEYPTSRPDVGKLARSTQDALTHIVWIDDAQIVEETHRKLYVEHNGHPGCWVSILVA